MSVGYLFHTLRGPPSFFIYLFILRGRRKLSTYHIIEKRKRKEYKGEGPNQNRPKLDNRQTNRNDTEEYLNGFHYTKTQ